MTSDSLRTLGPAPRRPALGDSVRCSRSLRARSAALGLLALPVLNPPAAKHGLVELRSKARNLWLPLASASFLPVFQAPATEHGFARIVPLLLRISFRAPRDQLQRRKLRQRHFVFEAPVARPLVLRGPWDGGGFRSAVLFRDIDGAKALGVGLVAFVSALAAVGLVPAQANALLVEAEELESLAHRHRRDGKRLAIAPGLVFGQPSEGVEAGGEQGAF